MQGDIVFNFAMSPVSTFLPNYVGIGYYLVQQYEDNSPKPATAWLPSGLGPVGRKLRLDTAITFVSNCRVRRGRVPAGPGLALVNNSSGWPRAGEYPSSTDYLLCIHPFIFIKDFVSSQIIVSNFPT